MTRDAIFFALGVIGGMMLVIGFVFDAIPGIPIANLWCGTAQ